MSPTPAPDGAVPEQLLGEIQWVHALAAGLVRDDSRADDIAQETLLAALKNPPKGNVRAWLSKVVRYRQWNQLRTDQNRQRREQGAARSEALPSTSEVMERAETQRRLVEAVFGLREPYRTTVVLRYFEGMTTDQVAQQQRVEPATVRSRLRRGLGQLREQLDDEYGDRKTWCLALAPLVMMHNEAVAAAANVLTAASAAGTAAGGSSAIAGSSAISGTLWGGLIMSTKTVTAAVVAAAVLIGALVVWKSADTTSQHDQEQAAAPHTAHEHVGTEMGNEATQPLQEQLVASETTANSAVTATKELLATPTAARETGTGAITGKVTDPVGRPLAGMIVHAVKNDAPSAFVDAELPFGLDLLGVDVPPIDEPNLRAETDRAGVFSVGELPDGLYSVVVRGAGRRQHVEKRITVVADQTAEIQVELAEGHRIEGIVIDPSNRPVAGAEVAVNSGMRIQSGDNTSIMISIGGDGASGEVKTTTDRHGRFVLDGLATGNQTLTASHESWAPGSLADVASGSTDIEIRLREGTPVAGVVLSPDGESVVDAQVRVMRGFGEDVTEVATDDNGAFAFDHLPPGRLQLLVVAPGYPLLRESLHIVEGEPVAALELRLDVGTSAIGVVQDGAGQPLANVSVRLAIGDSHESSAVARTDETGAFRVEGLAVGESYGGSVSHKEFLEYEVHDFAAVSGENDLGTIVLSVGGSLSGFVQNAAGEPVEGARVSLRVVRTGGSDEDKMAAMLLGMGDLDFDFDLGGGKSGKTGADGSYLIQAIEPGTYKVRARCAGYRSFKGGEVAIADGPTTEQAPIVLERGFAITGRVVDPDGNAVAGASVSATAGFPDLAAKRTKSDTDGYFEIAGLEDKSYNVSAKATNYSPANAKDVAAGAVDMVLKLQKTASFSGVVIDAATGMPVSSFGVKLTPKARNFQLHDFSLEDLSRMSTSGEVHRFQSAGGEFRVDGFNPGDYTCSVTADDFIAYEGPVKLRSGADEVVEISLDRGGAIEGYVRDSQGQPIKGATISRASAGGKKKHTMSIGMTMTVGGGSDSPLTTVSSFGDDSELMTDENGYFLLTGIPPGKVDLQVKHRKYMDGSIKQMEVVRGETRQAPAVELALGGRIYGTVYNSKGEPTQTATILIYQMEDGKRGEPRFLMPQENGVYSQSGLAAGEYEIDVHVIEMQADGGGGFGMITAAVGGEEGDEEEERQPAAIVTLTEGAQVLQDLHPQE